MIWITIRNLRRSRMSDSTPAGIASRKIGKVPAAWIIETAAGELDRSVMSQELATSRMKLPVLPSTVAAQRTAKTVCRRGAKLPDDEAGCPLEANSSVLWVKVIAPHRCAVAFRYSCEILGKGSFAVFFCSRHRSGYAEQPMFGRQ